MKTIIAAALAASLACPAAAQVFIEGDVVTAYDQNGNYYHGRVDGGIVTLYGQNGETLSGLVDRAQPTTNLYGDTGQIGVIEPVSPETSTLTLE